MAGWKNVAAEQLSNRHSLFIWLGIALLTQLVWGTYSVSTLLNSVHAGLGTSTAAEQQRQLMSPRSVGWHCAESSLLCAVFHRLFHDMQVCARFLQVIADPQQQLCVASAAERASCVTALPDMRDARL